MLCLPYLKLQTWRFRWRLMGRSLGWRQPPVIENRSYFERSVRSALRHLPSAVPLWVQAHPKNEAHHGLIDQLLRPLHPHGVLELLASTDPLEVRLSSGWSGEVRRPWRVLGSAPTSWRQQYLAPHHEVFPSVSRLTRDGGGTGQISCSILVNGGGASMCVPC